MTTGTALVLFSGGQDSTVCLAWALDRFQRVETAGFAYGQRHGIELAQRQRVIAGMGRLRKEWRERLGADTLIEMPELGRLSETALTRETAIALTRAGLPTTFVPGRNLLFFTYAAALAYRRNIPLLIGGMCETDFSGYPDCRNETMRSLEKTLSLGMGRDVSIETPLMWIDKAGTWQLAEDLGGAPFLELIIEETHTCYLGDRSKRHAWGYGCAACPACDLRAKGWAAWQASRLD